MVQGFTEICYAGQSHRVPVIRSKRKVTAVIYDGTLYPEPPTTNKIMQRSANTKLAYRF